MIEADKIYIKLYALISAIESDMSDILHSFPRELINSSGLETIKAHAAKEDAIIEATLSQKISAIKKIGSITSSKLLIKMADQVERIVPVRNRVFHKKPLEYGDNEIVISVANSIIKMPNQNLNATKKTIQSLDCEEKNFLKSINAVFESDNHIIHNLPQPDFYETGYIGRKDIRKQLVNDLLRGPYPAITIVGEGGLGKTALALAATWEITEQSESPFELIVWTTAKRTKLLGFTIDRDSTAFSTGYSMLSSIVDFAGGDKDDARASIKEIMSNFKTLLVVDNLETVLDDDLRWLALNMHSGSKVLFTSRVQIAAGDKPISLEPMSNKDARQLFRAFSSVNGLRDQASLGDDQTDAMLSKLNYNPLFIKWFIQALKAGATTDKILSKRDVIVEYCMENVLDNLSDGEENVLGALLTASAPRDMQKVSFMTKLSGDVLEDSISGLIRRNIVVQRTHEERTMFDVNMIAKKYTLDKKIFNNSKIANWLKLERSFKSEMSNFEATTEWKYNPRDVYIDKEEYVFSYRKVKSAGVYAAKEDYAQAIKRLDEARKVTPNYFEIYRVMGFVFSKMDDFLGAKDAYQTAIEIAPTVPTIRYFFADFLLRSEDVDGAIEQAREGMSLDPNSAPLRALLARALTYVGRLDDAWREICASEPLARSAHDRRICLDRRVDILSRQLEKHAQDKTWVDAGATLELLLKSLSEELSIYIDDRVKSKVYKQRYWIREVGHKSGGDGLVAVADEILKIVSPYGVDSDGSERWAGEVKTINYIKKFGFIRGDDGQEHFFHRSNLRVESEFESLSEGTRVSFGFGENANGRCANGIEVAS